MLWGVRIIDCTGLIFVVFYFDNQKFDFIFVKRGISAHVNPQNHIAYETPADPFYANRITAVFDGLMPKMLSETWDTLLYGNNVFHGQSRRISFVLRKNRFISGDNNVELYRNLLRREEICKAHCNFGWKGLCDGYYSFWLYDTTCSLPAGDADKSVGDKIGRDNSIFDTNLKMLTCLPNK